LAFGLKYTSTFHQIKSYSTTGEWKVDIYLEGYVGASSSITLERNTISLKRDGEYMSNIQSTTFSFGIYNITEEQFKEFSSASWGDYKVVVTYDPSGVNQTKFIGYNQTEIYTEPFVNPPYPSMLNFTCGLAHLKYERWDNSGTLYTGQKSLIEILRLATNKLPTGLNYREFINVYEDNQNANTTDSMLNQTYLDAELFKVMSKPEGGAIEEDAFMGYRVIEEILKVFGATIYQWDGIWWIVRKQEYKDTTMYYRNFNANVGTESTITIASTGNLTTNERTINNANTASTDIIFPSAEGEREVYPPLNRAQVTYSQQNLDFQDNDLLRNGEFEEIDFTATATTNNGFPSWWTPSAGLGATNYFGIGTIAGGAWGDTNTFQFNPSSYKTASSLDATQYIQYEKFNIPVATADKIQMTFSFYLQSSAQDLNTSSNAMSDWKNFMDNYATITFETQIKLGTYYLVGDAINGYVWGTTAGYATFERNGLSSGDYYGNWMEGVFTFSELMPTLPETGLRDLQFRVYEPYNDIYSYGQATASHDTFVDYIAVSGFEMMYLPSGLEPVETQIIYADINEDENYEEIDIIIGDSINTISQGALKLSTGINTDNWNRRGGGDNTTIQVLLITQLKQDRGGFGEFLNGKLIGEFEGHNTFQMTVGATTSDYVMLNFNYMLELNEWTTTLFKLQTFNPSITLTDSVTYNPAPIPLLADIPVSNNPASRTSSSAGTLYGGNTQVSASNTNLLNFN